MEDKHQLHFIMIKTRGVYNQSLMLRLSFGRFVSKHVCNTLTHKGPRSHYVPNTQKQSHSALFSWSYNCFSFLSSLTKAVELKEVSLYNNGGGGYGPSNDGKECLSFGVVPISWEQEAQRGIPRPYPHNRLPARHLTKLLDVEASF